MSEMELSNTGLYDVHCHLLPGIDDGCKTAEESVLLMKESYSQGVRGMIATPHYYPKETIEDFLKRRQQAIERLKPAMEGQDKLPSLAFGAEVYYYPGIVHAENLRKLCMGKSDYMLLELPFSKWGPSVLREVQILRNSYGVNLILAHLERYFKIQDKSMIEELLSYDVMIQMNGEYLLDFWSGRKARAFLAEGNAQFLGSDSHNMNNRKPNLGPAYNSLIKKKMFEVVEEVRENGEILFEKCC